MTTPTHRASPTPTIISNAGDLLARYSVLFCDVWGVVHDGVRAYPGATDALLRFRSAGGTVVLLTNAPVPVPRVIEMLETRHVSPETYDAIVSSGEIALSHMAERGYKRVHFIGPPDRDAAFFNKATAVHAPLAEAEAVVCTGLFDDVNETVASYTDLLTEARARDLPFVCANPDFVVEVGGRLYLCAGALADAYRDMGGEVYWAGKPHASAYVAASAAAEKIRGAPFKTRDVLVVGDAVRTDLAGAAMAGLDALFVAGGIHRHDVMIDGAIDRAKLDALFEPGAPGALAAMTELRW